MASSPNNPTMVSRSVGSLPCYSFRLSPSNLTKAAFKALSTQPELPGVLIIESGKCLGMISRQKYFETLSQRFGTDIYLNRPIRALYESFSSPPVFLPAEMQVDLAAKYALSRPPDQRYEPLIIEFNPTTQKLLDVYDLLLAQSQLLTDVNQLVEQQVEIGRALSSTLMLEEVLNLILEKLAILIPFDHASIMLQQSDFLEYVATHVAPTAAHLDFQRVFIDPNGLYWQICQTKQPVLQNGINHSIDSTFEEAYPEGYSWLGVPLIHGETTIGILSLARHIRNPFSKEILPLAQSFAVQATVALQNARIFKEVYRLATTDSLTSIHNRAEFYRLAEQEFDRARRYIRPLSMVMLDVDHFKKVNDHYGHDLGDQVLQAIARRCRENLREIDLFGRYGGEEFLILMPETTETEAFQAAERIRASIEQLPFSIKNLSITATISLGIASLSDTFASESLNMLIQCADQAMYSAKSAGRNQCVIWQRSTMPEPDIQYVFDGSELEKPDAAAVSEDVLAGSQSALTHEDWPGAVLESIPSALMISEQTGRILWANLLFAELVGFSIQKIIGETIQNLYHLMPNNQLMQCLVNAVNSGQIWNGRVAGYRENRLMYQAKVTMANLRLDPSKIDLIMTTIQDITEHEQAKAEARRKADTLFRQSELQLKRITALRAIDSSIASGRDLETTLNLLLERLTDLLEVSASAIMLYEAGSQRLKFRAGHGFHTKDIFSANLQLNASFAGQAASRREIIRVEDLTNSKTASDFAAFILAENFIAYYAIPLIANGLVIGVLEVFHRSELNPDLEWADFLKTLGGQAAIAIQNAELFEHLQHSNNELSRAYDATLLSWNQMLGLRDQETGDHTDRVVELAVELGRAMLLNEEEILHLRRGALLHDIGKMGTPDRILHKNGPLTDEELAIMRLHPVYAYTMLKDIQFLLPALDIPYCHHEKWDGTGYPRGLAGENIPLSARIFAVVDVWDALSANRRYRRAWPSEKVRAYIIDNAGSHFDPRIVEKFLNLIE